MVSIYNFLKMSVLGAKGRALMDFNGLYGFRVCPLRHLTFSAKKGGSALWPPRR